MRVSEYKQPVEFTASAFGSGTDDAQFGLGRDDALRAAGQSPELRQVLVICPTDNHVESDGALDIEALTSLVPLLFAPEGIILISHCATGKGWKGATKNRHVEQLGG